MKSKRRNYESEDIDKCDSGSRSFYRKSQEGSLGTSKDEATKLYLRNE
jgi:hypothetical protein